MKNQAEAMPNAAEEPKKLDFQDKDIDALMDAFEEADTQKTGNAQENIQALADSLDRLGDDLQKEAQHNPEMERVTEIRSGLTKLVAKEAIEEVQYLLDGRQTMLSGDEMVTMVIDLALERAGMKKGTKAETLAAFTSNSELRAKAKEELVLNLQAKMIDPETGNDSEKVSRLEKALDALEK